MIEVHKGAVRPKALPDFLAPHHLSRPLQQHAQDLQWLALQFQPSSLLPQLACVLIQLEDSKPEKTPPGAWFHAQQCKQFGCMVIWSFGFADDLAIWSFDFAASWMTAVAFLESYKGRTWPGSK
jgi:hypothetical protein